LEIAHPAIPPKLVYLVYNTITNLLTQDDQVRCFENAARRLAPGGVFVVECGLPSWAAIRQRLAWPAELDLMARIAGLRLRERWDGWNGEGFTASSTRHVSVYETARR
jgi:hypothetical protein